MRISKKNLLYLLKENLEEMAMDFTTADRPESGLQRKLATGDTPHGKIPYPETGRPNQNFQELLGSERYQQVVDKLREYIPGAPPLSGISTPQQLAQNPNMYQLIVTMMEAHNSIVAIERNHRTGLEQLAVELVKKEMAIPEGSLQFDAKIVGMGEIDTEDFNREGNERPPQGGEEQGGEMGGEEQGGDEQDEPDLGKDFDVEEDLFHHFEVFDIEKAKRRMINSIIQGASKRGHYMYHYVAEQITRITGSDDLIKLYGILMSINDTLYWQVSDETMKAAMGGGGGQEMVGGKESVNVQTTPPTIIVRAANFPVLVHELIKGVMELFGTRGRSEDMYKDVEAEEDTMEHEVWDLRLGPAIWDRLRSQFPEEILIDENKIELQNYLLTEIFELPAKKFLTFFMEVLSKTKRGERMMYQLMENVYKVFNHEDTSVGDEDFEAELDQAAEEVSDEDLMNFLTSMGIKLDRPPGDENFFSKN